MDYRLTASIYWTTRPNINLIHQAHDMQWGSVSQKVSNRYLDGIMSQTYG